MQKILSDEEIEYALLLQRIYTNSKGDCILISNLNDNHIKQAINKTRILLNEKEFIKRVPRLKLVLLLNELNSRRDKNSDSFGVE